MKKTNAALALVITVSVVSGCSRQEKDTAMSTTTASSDKAGEVSPFDNAPASREPRIKALLDQLSTDQKIQLISGTGWDRDRASQAGRKVPGAAGFTVAIESLGIPSIVLTDGPAGVRIWPERPGSEQTYYATAFPVATVISSSWDLELAEAVGNAMGHEVKEYGADILLAPGMNIHRDPRGGRNFEYFSEDPYLNGRMAASVVKGIQSQGVGATPKHYVANNQETNRYVVDTIVSERALREIYLKGFEIVVAESDPWAIMSAYNQVNGTPASHDETLLSTVLRDEWGFNGVVMTDWFAGMDDTVAQMRAGNEMLMPGMPEGTAQIARAVESGELPEAVLDRNVGRILDVVLRSPAVAGYAYSDAPDLEASAAVARRAAAAGTVLLKNDNRALPLATGIRRIAAFGNTSYDFISGGTGSGDVNEAYTVSLVQGLEAQGLQIDQALRDAYEAYIAQQKAALPDKKEFWEFQPPPPEMPISSDLIAQQAATTEVALVTIGRNSGEFQDRPLAGDFYLTDSEKALIADVSAAFRRQGKHTIVILNIGNVVETASWRDAPDAILVPWQGGQEAGNAVVDVLMGKVNPSGKLPTTFPRHYDDAPTAKNFPGYPLSDEKQVLLGIFEAQPWRVEYREGIYVGYRYYDTFDVDPAYEFGYGLSYTQFGYGDVALNRANFDNDIEVTVTVTNTGPYPGNEVVQLYVSAPGQIIHKPAQELKGFARTRLLAPGEAQTLRFTLDADSLASFHDDRRAWIVEPGTHRVRVGASSRDTRGEATFSVEGELVAREVIAELSPDFDLKEISP